MGSEALPAGFHDGSLVVSDQPSWGRRVNKAANYATISGFQTNPRGVGGDSDGDGTSGVIVSDQPSWGRRHRTVDVAHHRNRVSDQPSWGRRLHDIVKPSDVPTRFRPTLVGSEVQWVAGDVGCIPVSDQPSWGRRGPPRCDVGVRRRFQTNPRGVGGVELESFATR